MLAPLQKKSVLYRIKLRKNACQILNLISYFIFFPIKNTKSLLFLSFLLDNLRHYNNYILKFILLRLFTELIIFTNNYNITFKYQNPKNDIIKTLNF